MTRRRLSTKVLLVTFTASVWCIILAIFMAANKTAITSKSKFTFDANALKVTADVLVAGGNIPEGSSIIDSKLSITSVPIDARDAGALASFNEAKGLYAAELIPEGTIILKSMVTEESAIANSRPYKAGNSIVSVTVDNPYAVNSFLVPGAYVDVGLITTRTPKSSRYLVQRALVRAIDGSTKLNSLAVQRAGSPAQQSTVQISLEVPDSDAQILTGGKKLGKYFLTLRATTDDTLNRLEEVEVNDVLKIDPDPQVGRSIR